MALQTANQVYNEPQSEVLANNVGLMVAESERASPSVELFTHIQPVWQRMYADCLAAKESIYFEQYILANDEIGAAFLKLFEQKAREGVQLRLTFDFIGSRDIQSSELVNAIRKSGGRIRFYNRLRFKDITSPSRWVPRNHCKTLVIDSRIAYVGSACIADSMKDWRDFHLRIADRPVNGLLSGEAAQQADDIVYVTHEPRQKPNPIYQALLDKINGAQKNIYLVTPYFFPPFALRRAMHKAVKRGVNVTIMLSKKSDVPFLSFCTRSYFPWLISRGVNIIFYTQSLLHAKYAVVDDDWAMLGSTNFDYLSLRYNKEGNLMIHGGALVQTLKGIFETDALICEQADKDPGIFLKIFMPLVKVIRQWL